MTTAITLKKVPKEIRDFLLEQQLKVKKNKQCQFSIEQTIYKIIKAHPEFTK